MTFCEDSPDGGVFLEPPAGDMDEEVVVAHLTQEVDWNALAVRIRSLQ